MNKKQEKPVCKGRTKKGIQCKNQISVEESFCRIHKPPRGFPSYFRSLSQLWKVAKEKMGSLDRKSSDILGVNINASVIFADLCGFSGLGAKYPEHPHVSAFIGHHYLSLLESWGRVSGDINKIFIDKFVGDQVMLVIPGKCNESKEIALRVIRNWFFGPNIYKSKVGMHWGTVWLGDVGLRKDGNRHEKFDSVTVMGQTVNIAARLCGKAGEDELLLLGEKNPEDSIVGVGMSPFWKVERKRIEDGLKNIIEGPIEVCKLTHERLTELSINMEELLEKVKSDQPEFLEF